jgi:hypothetical protein
MTFFSVSLFYPDLSRVPQVRAPSLGANLGSDFASFAAFSANFAVKGFFADDRRLTTDDY